MQEVFKRYEKKYMLTAEKQQALMERIGEHLQADEYGAYTICNVYYDTPDYELIRHSIEKPLYKEKLRLRSYGIPGAEDKVFLEIKKKFDGIVYKRRAGMTLREANRYLEQGIRPKKDGQIQRELDFFCRRYDLRPAVYLAYDRVAYKGREDAALRVTFDSRVRCRQEHIALEAGDEGELLIPEDCVLMEVKLPGGMPLWLARALSELAIYPVSYSKYGTYYMNCVAGKKFPDVI